MSQYNIWCTVHMTKCYTKLRYIARNAPYGRRWRTFAFNELNNSLSSILFDVALGSILFDESMVFESGKFTDRKCDQRERKSPHMLASEM